MGFLQQPQRGARKSGRVDCFSRLPRLLRKPLIAPFSSFPRRRESSPDQIWRIDSRLRGNDGDGVSATASASQVGHCERSKNRIVHGQIERRSMLRRNGWQAKRGCTADIRLGSGAVGVDPGGGGCARELNISNPGRRLRVAGRRKPDGTPGAFLLLAAAIFLGVRTGAHDVGLAHPCESRRRSRWTDQRSGRRDRAVTGLFGWTGCTPASRARPSGPTRTRSRCPPWQACTSGCRYDQGPRNRLYYLSRWL